MNKNTVFLISLFLILAILYVANFTDVLKHKYIQIHWTPSRANAASVSFFLDKDYPLTSVEVVATEEARTNKFPHPLWYLVAAAEPVATKTFSYGNPIPGMKPKVSTALPEPLQPDTDYSLLVEASSGLKGEKSFSIAAH
jgi:hypothetical protein